MEEDREGSDAKAGRPDRRLVAERAWGTPSTFPSFAAEVEAAFAAFSGSHVATFVPILVESRVNGRLQQTRVS